MRVLGKQIGILNSVVRWVSWREHRSRLRRREGESLVKILGGNIPGTRNSQCKGSITGGCLIFDEYQRSAVAGWNNQGME